MFLKLVFLSVWITAISIGGTGAETPSVSLTTDHLRSLFRAADSGWDKVRNPLTNDGTKTKNATREYLRRQFKQIVETAGSKNAIFAEESYQTEIYASNSGGKPTEITGINFRVLFYGSVNATEDEPLIVIANYDTDHVSKNPIDDNGSGVVALIALSDYLARHINQGSVVLKKTVIFIASDTSLGKYDNGRPDNAKSGAEVIAKEYITNFLYGRKSFAGAIVLDNILNYNNTKYSQNSQNSGLNESFPEAYQQLQKEDFAGNFLALVHRNDKLDNPLVESFQRGWNKAAKQTKGQSIADPKLVKFTFTTSTTNSAFELHLLRSEQTEFWNHHIERAEKEFPAILLTDTEKYRASPCSTSMCTIEKMVTEQNLDFMRRIVLSVHETIVDRQSNGTPALQHSLVVILCGIFLRMLINTTF